MSGELAGALGLLEVRFEKQGEGYKYNFDLKPELADVRQFRNILLSPETRKDKRKLYDSICNFSYSLIKRCKPEETEENIRAFVDVYADPLLELFMIAFKWTTKEDKEKNRQMMMDELKKKMSED